MNEVEIITDDQFYDRYKPIKNHLDDNASFDGCLFETYGKEIEHVLLVRDSEPNRVWTVVDADGQTIISNGFQLVNRIGYIITEIPFMGKFCEVIDEDEMENLESEEAT